MDDGYLSDGADDAETLDPDYANFRYSQHWICRRIGYWPKRAYYSKKGGFYPKLSKN